MHERRDDETKEDRSSVDERIFDDIPICNLHRALVYRRAWSFLAGWEAQTSDLGGKEEEKGEKPRRVGEVKSEMEIKGVGGMEQMGSGILCSWFEAYFAICDGLLLRS